MSLNAAQLLKTLGAGILPGGASQTKAPDSATFDFAALLQKAERGELTSGRSLIVDDSVSIDLSPDQLSSVIGRPFQTIQKKCHWLCQFCWQSTSPGSFALAKLRTHAEFIARLFQAGA